MSKEQPNNPLHGLTLEMVVTQLFDHYGWEGLAKRVNINSFKKDPSVKSSLKFLRRTPWARDQVEALYVATFASSGSSASSPQSSSPGWSPSSSPSSSPSASPWDSCAPQKPQKDE